MSRFVCILCNKEFTSNYGLKKHNDKKIPCNVIPIKKAKNLFKCTVCDKILSSKQNLDNHMFNHRLDAIKVRNIETTTETTTEITTGATTETTTETNIDTTIDDYLENNLIEDPINISIPKPNNSIEILVEEYNYFKDEINRLKKENQKLKDENQKLNKTINTTINNIDNRTTTINNIDNSTNTTQINNIQINIMSFANTPIKAIHINNNYNDKKSSLYDFSKIFNYDNFNYPIEKNGLNHAQRCKEEKLKKIIANNRKKIIILINLGFCEILSEHFSDPMCKNLRYITRNLFESYNDGKWESITPYCAKRTLLQNFIEGLKECSDAEISKLFNKYRSMIFIINDYYRNHQEYHHYGNNEFINVIKKIYTN